MACRDMFPTMEPLPCPTFEDAFTALESGEADLAMIPIENTIAGRVADIHYLLPESRLHNIGEYFMPIRFTLMALPGETREDRKSLGDGRGVSVRVDVGGTPLLNNKNIKQL